MLPRDYMKKTIFAVIFLGLCTFLPASPVQAARLSDAEVLQNPAAENVQTEVTIDFREVDLRVVAKFISDLTGKNFVFDKRVRDKVTVFSPTKVTPDEAYRLFEAVLKVHGFTTVPADGLIMIVPSQEARSMKVETRAVPPPPGVAPEDRVVTQLIRLEYAEASEMKVLLTPLLEKTGVVLAYESGNTLIVTDYASNIDRLLKIIRILDVDRKDVQLSVIKLEYASARDLAVSLQEVLKTPPTRGQQPPTKTQMSYTVVPDERTNSLIVLARTAELETIRSLAAKLDVPSPRGSDRVHVYFLQNAVAEELAKVLTDLAGPGATPQPQEASGPRKLLLQENVFITADKATNSLIIRAERQDYLVLKDIIEKLDIQRAQVLVEAVIMETSFKKALALGAEWRLLNFPTEAGETVGFGGTNLPAAGVGTGLINQMAAQPFAGPAGLVLGAAEGTITYGGTTYLNLGLLIQALQQDSEVNILSTPHLLTMDNEEARIVVGEERPFLKSSMVTETGAVTPTVTRTYDFKDLGLTLKMTPHITQDDYIKLKIFQQIKNFIAEAETGAISATKRETETTVQVRNRETVVIGGLIRDDTRQSKTQVPCLGNIPVLGWAFKQQAESGDKTNLLILISPTIVRTPEQLRELTEKKRTETEEAGRPPKTDALGRPVPPETPEGE